MNLGTLSQFLRALLVPAAVLLVAAAVYAAPPRAADALPVTVRGDLGQRIDQLLDERAGAGFNGTVLVEVEDSIILHKAYGWADSAHSKPVSLATPFWIASISKQFAAAAVLKLEEQGRLSLDDPITRFFASVPEEKRGITLHELLTHTAGLAQHYAADGITDRDAAVRAILAPPLARAPGEGFGYSNDAYNLIAAVVEVAAGQPYEEFLRQQLLEPAGLVHTGFWGPAAHPEVASILGDDALDAAIYRPNWGFRGGVGMYATAGDLYRWYQALQHDTVLSAASRERLLTPYVMRGAIGVAYGWFESRGPGGTRSVWTRGFESFGHGAVLAAYPERRVIIVVTSNSGERSPDVPVSHALATELAELVLAPH